MTVEEIKEIVLEADPEADHYFSDSKAPAYTVWAEYEGLPYSADNRKLGWRVQIDRYHKDEHDTMVDKIAQVLHEHGIPYQPLVDYDQDTGYIRHIFDCEMM